MPEIKPRTFLCQWCELRLPSTAFPVNKKCTRTAGVSISCCKKCHYKRYFKKSACPYCDEVFNAAAMFQHHKKCKPQDSDEEQDL